MDCRADDCHCSFSFFGEHEISTPAASFLLPEGEAIFHGGFREGIFAGCVG